MRTANRPAWCATTAFTRSAHKRGCHHPQTALIRLLRHPTLQQLDRQPMTQILQFPPRHRLTCPSWHVDNGKPVAHVVDHPTLPGPLPPALPFTGIRPSSTARRKRSRLESVALALAALLFIGTGVLALQQHSVANKWMHDDQQEVHHNAELMTALDQSHAQIKRHNAIVARVVLDAAAIAGDLHACVVDMNTVANDLSQIVVSSTEPRRRSLTALRLNRSVSRPRLEPALAERPLRRLTKGGLFSGRASSSPLTAPASVQARPATSEIAACVDGGASLRRFTIWKRRRFSY